MLLLVSCIVSLDHICVISYVLHSVIGSSLGIGRVISYVGSCVYVCAYRWVAVCLCVHALKGKWLELSTPKMVDIQGISVTWHALTLSLQGQRSENVAKNLH